MEKPVRKPARRQPARPGSAQPISAQPRRSSIPWTAVIAAAVAAAPLVLVVALTQRTTLEDRFNLVPQPPSAEIERLALATTMTPLAQRLFYRQDPTIAPRSAFLEQCKAVVDMIVLGCYLQESWGDRVISGKIILQDIQDPKFTGIVEVTAAHEMLHAAYDQLDDPERQWLSQQLQLARKGVTNQRLVKLLDAYEAQDRERYLNELHSYLGTELRDFGNPALEVYYQRYFRDRQAVVALAEQSSQVLTDLDQQAEALEAEIEQLESNLKPLKREIQDQEARLGGSLANLEQLKASLAASQATAEAALAVNEVGTEQRLLQFEQERARFNRAVEDHNAEVEAQSQRVARFNQQVQTYQDKVGAYNQIALANRKVMESLAGPISQPEAAASP